MLPIRKGTPGKVDHPSNDTGSGFTPGYRFPLPAGPVSFDCTHQPASREGPKPARPFFPLTRPCAHWPLRARSRLSRAPSRLRALSRPSPAPSAPRRQHQPPAAARRRGGIQAAGPFLPMHHRKDGTSGLELLMAKTQETHWPSSTTTSICAKSSPHSSASRTRSTPTRARRRPSRRCATHHPTRSCSTSTCRASGASTSSGS